MAVNIGPISLIAGPIQFNYGPNVIDDITQTSLENFGKQIVVYNGMQAVIFLCYRANQEGLEPLDLLR